MTGSKMPSLMARLALRLAVALAGLMPLQASAEEILAPFQRSDGSWGYVKLDACCCAGLGMWADRAIVMGS